MRHIFIFLFLLLSGTTISAAEDVLAKSVRDAVGKVSPRLVRIDTIGGFDSVTSAGQKELANEGATTGLLLDTQGHIITSSFNFLHDPSSILVRLHGGTLKVAKKVANDSNRMLTLLKIELPDNPPQLEPLESVIQNKVRIGQYVVAVGWAFSVEEPNVSLGIISGENRIWGKAMQTDAKVSPNNYGGPLIDLQGRILGILVPLSATSDAVTGGAEMYDAGVGLAIPIADVIQSFQRLKSGKNLEPGHLGLGFSELGLFTGEAVLDSVVANAPAAKAGIQKGDKILKINDKPVGSAMQAMIQLRPRYAEDTVRMTLQRTGENKEFVAEMKMIPPSELRKIVRENKEKEDKEKKEEKEDHQ